MEPILPILDSESGLSGFVEWWGSATEMGGSHEFCCDGDASEDANWISVVPKLGAVDLHFGSAGDWASQRSNLRKPWWVEEDELESIGIIISLAVECYTHLHADFWWLPHVWWTRALGVGRGSDDSSRVTEFAKVAKCVVCVIDIILVIEW